MIVEKGPSPATEIPWDASTFPDTYPEINSGLHRVATEIATVDDCRAIVHRVNHWDKLIAERDALAARVAELEWKLGIQDVAMAKHGTGELHDAFHVACTERDQAEQACDEWRAMAEGFRDAIDALAASRAELRGEVRELPSLCVNLAQERDAALATIGRVRALLDMWTPESLAAGDLRDALAGDAADKEPGT